MNTTYSFEQFCPKENKNVLVNAEITNEGQSEMVCSNNNNCGNECNCITRVSQLINNKNCY